MELYRYAVEIFEDQINKQSFLFDYNLRIFKAINLLYCEFYPYFKSVASRLN
jgi:hypothetical protein